MPGKCSLNSMVRWPWGINIFYSFGWGWWGDNSWWCCGWCGGWSWKNVKGRTPMTGSNNGSPKMRLNIFDCSNFREEYLKFSPLRWLKISRLSIQLCWMRSFLLWRGTASSSVLSSSRTTVVGWSLLRVSIIEVCLLFCFLSLGWGLREELPSPKARGVSWALFWVSISCICC